VGVMVAAVMEVVVTADNRFPGSRTRGTDGFPRIVSLYQGEHGEDVSVVDHQMGGRVISRPQHRHVLTS
jgi:hypothetical protein